jgi:hypothetical protein
MLKQEIISMPVRPKSVSKPLRIGRLNLIRGALDGMPDDARRLFFLFGHIANEINTLNRLTLFCVKPQSDAVLDEYSGSQIGVVLRLLIGKIHEGYRAVSDRILGSRFNATYIPYLKAEGREALARVKKEMNEWELLAAVRNGYSFHNPNDHQIDTAYAALPISTNLSILLGQSRHSYLFAMSNMLVTRAMFDMTQEDDDVKAQSRIAKDVIDKGGHLFDLIEHLLFTMIERENLAQISMEKDVLVVDGVESMRTFKIPPVCRS